MYQSEDLCIVLAYRKLVQKKNGRLLKLWSAKLSFYRPVKDLNTKIIALCSNQFIPFNF